MGMGFTYMKSNNLRIFHQNALVNKSQYRYKTYLISCQIDILSPVIVLFYSTSAFPFQNNPSSFLRKRERMKDVDEKLNRSSHHSWRNSTGARLPDPPASRHYETSAPAPSTAISGAWSVENGCYDSRKPKFTSKCHGR